MAENEQTWLPNLIAGVSIWKLAVDLNEPKFMDGRLLVPETEGSDSLPVTVRWNLDGLLPLPEAKAQFPAETEAATKEFFAALERVAKEFSTESSGYHKYKAAFTVPSLGADNGAHYFFDPKAKKLFVTNWGASPRSIGGAKEYVFGWERFADLMKDGATVTAAGGGLKAAVAENTEKKAEKDDKKDEKKEEKKDDDKKRPWWFWVLLGVVFLAILLLILWLLRDCEHANIPPNADAATADALADGATNAEAGADAAAADASTDGGDASADAAADGGDAGDGGKDASADAGKDGGKDAAADDDDDDDDDDDGSSGGLGSSGGSSGGGSSGGPVKVIVGPGGGAKGGEHRIHVQPNATAWRVASGFSKVSKTKQHGKNRFDVYLSPGKTFDGVQVQWEDASGHWHNH